MAGLSSAGKNVGLNALTAVAGFASLHTADPGSSGTSEVSGGSPAYARKAITWGAASAGVSTSSNAPVFDVPTSTTVTYLGLWSLVTSGTFYGSGLTTTGVFSSQGTYTSTSVTITAT